MSEPSREGGKSCGETATLRMNQQGLVQGFGSTSVQVAEGIGVAPRALDGPELYGPSASSTHSRILAGGSRGRGLLSLLRVAGGGLLGLLRVACRRLLRSRWVVGAVSTRGRSRGAAGEAWDSVSVEHDEGTLRVLSKCYKEAVAGDTYRSGRQSWMPRVVAGEPGSRAGNSGLHGVGRVRIQDSRIRSYAVEVVEFVVRTTASHRSFNANEARSLGQTPTTPHFKSTEHYHLNLYTLRYVPTRDQNPFP
jgi:hypothetical protein